MVAVRVFLRPCLKVLLPATENLNTQTLSAATADNNKCMQNEIIDKPTKSDGQLIRGGKKSITPHDDQLFHWTQEVWWYFLLNDDQLVYQRLEGQTARM